MKAEPEGRSCRGNAADPARLSVCSVPPSCFLRVRVLLACGRKNARVHAPTHVGGRRMCAWFGGLHGAKGAVCCKTVKLTRNAPGSRMNHIGAPSPSPTPFAQFPDTIAYAAVPARWAMRTQAATPAWHRAAGRSCGPASPATRRRWPTEAVAGTAGAAPAGAPRPARRGSPPCAPGAGSAGADGRARQRGARAPAPRAGALGAATRVRAGLPPDLAARLARGPAACKPPLRPSRGEIAQNADKTPCNVARWDKLAATSGGQMAGTGPAMTERKGASDSRVRVWMARLVRWAWAARQTRPARWAWAARQGQAAWRANAVPVRHNPMQREAGWAVAEVASSAGVAVR